VILFLSSLFIIFLALIELNAKLPNRGIFCAFSGGFCNEALCDPPLQSKSKGENAPGLIIKLDMFDIF